MSELHRMQGYPKIDIIDAEYAIEDGHESSDMNLSDFYAAVTALDYTTGFGPYTDAELRSIKIEGGSQTIWYRGFRTLKTAGYDARKGVENEPEGTTGITPPTEWRIENGGLTKPLASFDNGVTEYKKKWEYDLASNSGNTSNYSGWDTDTAGSTMGTASARVWMWVRDHSELPVEESGKRWYIQKKRVKPGIYEYLVSAPTVNRTDYYPTLDLFKTMASLSITAVGTIETPDNTMGVDGGEWLVRSVSGGKAGAFWTITISYVWAEDWDSDIYG